MADKRRHVNIPVFIPHLGCPNDCVFCNQRMISGHMSFDASSVDDEIARALQTVEEGADCEIAFFGGSFTGIDRSLMVYLLDVAKKYFDAGRISAVRLSTRPDYIDAEILGILGRYPVRTIELGIQSLSDRVLSASRRGHTAQRSLDAMKLVRDAGFSLIGQMMIGLPQSTADDEVRTAEILCNIPVDGARIYPTAVLCGTELAKMSERGEYRPLTVEEGVERSAAVLGVFAAQGIKVIRIGLCASDEMTGDYVVGGAYHPALGEMVKSRLYLNKCLELAGERFPDAESGGLHGKNLTIFAPVGKVSEVVGQRRANISRIISEYGLKNVRVIEKSGLMEYNIDMEINEASRFTK